MTMQTTSGESPFKSIDAGAYASQIPILRARLCVVVDADRGEVLFGGLDLRFVVETAERGQVWRAWRRTPGGAVLGTGGAEHRSQYYVQGDTLPAGWPGRSPEWVDAAREEWPPDWNKNDGTRL